MSTTTKKPRLTRKIRDMRVAIAKDVITQLKARKIKAKGGSYINANFRKGADYGKAKDLADLLPLVVGRCQVCALGACLISKARLYDKVRADRYVRDACDDDYWNIKPAIRAEYDELAEDLKAIFDPTTMDMIETAFETEEMGEPHDANSAIRFGEQYKLSAIRLRAIMTNIIKHDGEFRPDLALADSAK